MTDCLFCSIARAQVVAVVVAEDEHSVAFLDHRPVFKGHTLVVPRAHMATLADLPPDAIKPFFSAVQRIARAVEVGCGADGTFVAMNNKISQSVPHLHAHVVPRRKGDGLRGFFWPRTKCTGEAEMEEFASRIRAAVGNEAGQAQ